MTDRLLAALCLPVVWMMLVIGVGIREYQTRPNVVAMWYWQATLDPVMIDELVRIVERTPGVVVVPAPIQFYSTGEGPVCIVVGDEMECVP